MNLRDTLSLSFMTVVSYRTRSLLIVLAMALGVAVVAGMAYSNLDIANVIEQDAEISHLVLLIGFTYITTLFFGTRRYR